MAKKIPEPKYPPGMKVEQDPEQAERDAWLAEEDISIMPPEQAAQQEATALDLYVDTLLSKARDALGDMQRNRVLYEVRKRGLDEWLERAQRPLERRVAWLDAMITPLVPHVKPQGKARSRTLPNGVVGMRARPASVDIIDMSAAVAFARKHKLPVVEEVQKTPLKKYVEGGGKLPAGSGVEYTPADKHGQPYWKAASEEE
jgi:hypothetical protein